MDTNSKQQYMKTVREEYLKCARERTPRRCPRALAGGTSTASSKVCIKKRPDILSILGKTFGSSFEYATSLWRMFVSYVPRTCARGSLLFINVRYCTFSHRAMGTQPKTSPQFWQRHTLSPSHGNSSFRRNHP